MNRKNKICCSAWAKLNTKVGLSHHTTPPHHKLFDQLQKQLEIETQYQASGWHKETIPLKKIKPNPLPAVIKLSTIAPQLVCLCRFYNFFCYSVFNIGGYSIKIIGLFKIISKLYITGRSIREGCTMWAYSQQSIVFF